MAGVVGIASSWETFAGPGSLRPSSPPAWSPDRWRLGFATGHSAAGGIGALGRVPVDGQPHHGQATARVSDRGGDGHPPRAGRRDGCPGRAHLWFLVVMVVLWAAFQAVADVAGGTLRVPVALSALCMLLSAIGGGATATGALRQGLLTLGGAAWITGTEVVRHPPWRSPGRGMTDMGIKGRGRSPRHVATHCCWPSRRHWSPAWPAPTRCPTAPGRRRRCWVSSGRTRRRPSPGAGSARPVRRRGTTRRRVAGRGPDCGDGVVVLVVAVTAMQFVGPAATPCTRSS